MVGENFEIYSSQIPKNVFKFSTMVGENFETYSYQIPKDVFKLSAMVGENFENYCLLKLSDYCVERMRKSNPKNFPLPNLYFP